MRRISVFNDLFAKLHVSIPQDYVEELLKERLRTNINREKMLSIVLIFFCISLMYFDVTSLDTPLGNIYRIVFSIHTILIFLATIFLLCKYIGEKLWYGNITFWKVLHIAICSIVLTLCSLLTVMSEFSEQLPFSYVVSMFSIASMVFLAPGERILAFGPSLMLYVASMFIFNLSIGYIARNMFFTSLILILAFIISRNIYSSFVNNYIKSKVITMKNLELDQLNRIIEETLRKRTEELNHAVEYDKLRTNFFANISHELRTPLTVIFSAEQMLDSIFKNPNMLEKQKDVDKYISIIKQNCYRLIRLISNLIDITKLDVGHIHAYLGNHNIVKIVEDITLSVAKYIEYRNISLTFDTESEEIITALDPEKIERIMLNLLSNAVKFTPKGGHIWVNIFDREDRIDISVKDTGIGIPAEMKSLVFERFVQVDKSNTRMREGSGIGLSLVKSMVDLHDGCITLTSEEGAGSLFIIGIPKRIIPPAEISKESHISDEKQNIEKINIEFSDIYS